MPSAHLALRCYGAAFFMLQALHVAAAQYPPPESAASCEKAIGLVIEVEDKLSSEAFLPYLKHAADRCLTEKGERHPATLAVMGNLGSLYRELGRYAQALAFDEATYKARLAFQGERDPETLMAMNNLALSLVAVGRYQEALGLKQKVYEARKAMLGEAHPDTLSAMNNLASTLGDLGEHQQAAALLEQVVQGRSEKLGAEHRDTLAAMNNLAATWADLGQYERAIALQEQVLEKRRRLFGADHVNTLDSMSNLAINYGEAGLLDKALQLKEQVYNLRRARLGEDHPDTLKSMNSLANSLGDVGQQDLALALHEKALLLRRQRLGDKHPATIASMVNLANVYRATGRYDKALGLQEESLRLMRETRGDDHPETLDVMANLAVTYGDLRRPDQARALHEQVLVRRQAKLGRTHPDTLTSMSNLAMVLGELGQTARSLELKSEVLKSRQAALGAGHPDTLVAMNNLAAGLWDAGRHDEALVFVPQIVRGIETLRSGTGLSIGQRQTLFAPFAGLYWRYSSWFAQRQRLAEAADLADLSKARTLTESIRAQAAERSLPAPAQTRLASAQRAAQMARQVIEKQAASTPPDARALLAAQQQLEEAQRSHAAVQAELAASYPKYARLTALAPASAAQAARLLGDDEVFISYSVHEKGYAQAFIIHRQGSPRWIDLGTLSGFQQSVAAYRALLTGSPSMRGQLVLLKEGGYQWLGAAQTAPEQSTSVAADAQQARLLLERYWHEKLLKPVLPLTQDRTRWVISPDKDLALLPFDALPGTLDAAGLPGTSLSAGRSLTLVQSFAVWALLKEREAEYSGLKYPTQLLAMGNALYAPASAAAYERGAGVPAFEGSARGATLGAGSVVATPSEGGPAAAPVGASSAITATAPTALAEQFAMTHVTWQNLPGTAREVEAVSRAFRQAPGMTQEVLMGAKASEGNMLALQKAGRLKDFRYLLFSAHGYLAQNPSLSALVLSQQGNPAGIDGYITALEWPQYDMRSDLTVLSACDTGVGKAQAGESVMGLPYALFVAGNKNTLLSLWPVSDDATAEFMASFFSKLVAGTPQVQALVLTKREFQAHPRWSHPRFWAAFVLYGV